MLHRCAVLALWALVIVTATVIPATPDAREKCTMYEQYKSEQWIRGASSVQPANPIGAPGFLWTDPAPALQLSTLQQPDYGTLYAAPPVPRSIPNPGNILVQIQRSDGTLYQSYNALRSPAIPTAGDMVGCANR